MPSDAQRHHCHRLRAESLHACAIDKIRVTPVIANVSLLRRIAAIVLLALWLPATQYCTLVAAGIFDEGAPSSESAECCDTNDACDRDACKLLEDGVTMPANEACKVPAPDPYACLCFICLQLARPGSLEDSTLTVATPEQPLDWESSWQFVRRAAPLARAPSLLG